MAFSKKNKRKITVGGELYYWSATGSDGCISLHITTEVEGSSRLSGTFEYHHLQIKYESFTVSTGQFVITPYTVRQTILYALSTGWKPFDKGRDLNLGWIDDKIDLRLDKNRIARKANFNLI